MLSITMKCIKCDGEYIQERGKNARAINKSHLCGKCMNPINPIPERPVYHNPTVVKKAKSTTKKV